MINALFVVVFAACGDTAVPTKVTLMPPTPNEAPPPTEAPAPVAATVENGVLTLNTAKGPLVVTPVYHATTRVDAGGKVVWIDPWSKAALDNAPKADIVFITDTHFDHQDKDALAKVVKEGTVFVAPQAVRDGLPEHPITHVLANGAEAVIGDFTARAVPMYNLTRGPEEGGVFHEKGRGNGYVLSFGGRSVYFAGDTECTDEMKALTGIDVALIPMNLPYTMTPEEAAACVNAFKPAVVVPYHYAGSDLAAFKAAITATETKVELLEFYPGGTPW